MQQDLSSLEIHLGAWAGSDQREVYHYKQHLLTEAPTSEH